MNSARILQPFLDGGIESVKFFNGRLLTGEDMEREQLAQREFRALLGRAAGHGVAAGFGVEPARRLVDPALAIGAGLALNRQGEAVCLTRDVVLELVSTALIGAGSADDTGSGLFRTCAAPATGLYTIGNDLWLLAVSPARGPLGSAPVTGLGNSHTACNAKFVVEGVQFRLVQITQDFPGALSSSAIGRLRSTVAARCFDSAGALAHAVDPFLPTPRSTLLESLYDRDVLEPCEVPIAVFHWAASSGFGFVDRWCVRRRVTAGSIANSWGRAQLSDHGRSEAEALVYQFQDHIDDLHAGSPEVVRAREVFSFLPAFGVLPLAAGTARGFSMERFFDGLKVRPSGGVISSVPSFSAYTVIEAARVRGLLRDALDHPPLDVQSNLDPASSEVIRLYQVRENLLGAAGAARVQPYIIFARGAVFDHGAANFDVSHWDYATFS